MPTFSSMMGDQTILPIVQANTPEQGVEIAKAMQAANLKAVEVVLRTEQALATITAIKEQLPDLKVGAGTVLDEGMIDAVIKAGADFIVTPASTPKLLKALAESNIPALPGVASGSEVLMAREHGFSELKFFPAEQKGGAPFIKSISSVFAGISFCPTGGIHAGNKDDYLNLPNVFAVGGTWMAKPEWVANGEWQKITDACIEANQ
ncbi:bifunctional 4-hydroxy-2-oxoglutarate aldolase/2-dehydro-3-deoxy-phosphogluconate aldolase [Thalassotalea sp. PS06]|uniref:bifunctional 4-hydroxy-2-oxoglutarate aldolase/2-dehydro-3-deoxy-phosphogluconate aldolase n=1 Tax=Thalassotalea sp. PS06 TaxID=2594005 RepID=UPI0011654E3B|nr:bifunctional 4-hydroxy-2-oxoglutarate aldolase/2-dehydro-3-deoxy-phosphogluconate aldolase [Thalassotalea sp. PS06]QDO99902.1 bifunctional 4-hydroxy-2-oxoglutarate aldolase/2-dehydro-3-deoxy-phosphogluconate aldolase [Thalassotalea sp. PS06]